ncbi:MAG: amidohydrolase [Verrucomicrobiota bacterium]|nr:amidohydrolase [Verrucomicrobiota bacterium]
MNTSCSFSRREFLTVSTFAVAGATLNLPADELAPKSEPIIDIHQHLNYGGRQDPQFLAHQRALGITKTILLPAGRPVDSASTHDGVSNGLQAKCAGNEDCFKFAQEHPGEFIFGANEVPDVPEATREIEKYLKLGAVVIGESKFGVECDSPEMQKIFALAQEYNVPVLMHWQFQMYNYGFERFYKMLEKFPKVNFLGHAQTWWANIDKDYKDHLENNGLYPRTRVTPGGTTDRYLSDYANMFGDLSAGSGLGALVRDEEHTRGFLERHQDKLLYGSDCSDTIGRRPGCQGAQTIAAIRRLAPSKKIERKLLYENARKLFRIS